MDIVNFFERAEGSWFSQRTTHFIQGQPSQTGQTTLDLIPLATEAPEIVPLCQHFGADPTDVLLALRISQEGGQGGGLYGNPPTQQGGNTLFVVMKAVEAMGQFLSQIGNEPPTEGQYHLNEEVLTLVTDTAQLHSEERIWYLNPNLRMRTSFATLSDGFQLASFCSEIRRGVPRAASE
ncbi:MAG: phycobiliprotein lyase [Cyanobacteria bacterium]|nr:phycobiliprotein lyase [Cyanobacteriota bacterium]MDA0865015.1 phycobiliprotein lyase [Cyanobacteriota bacterium]